MVAWGTQDSIDIWRRGSGSLIQVGGVDALSVVLQLRVPRLLLAASAEAGEACFYGCSYELSLKEEDVFNGSPKHYVVATRSDNAGNSEVWIDGRTFEITREMTKMNLTEEAISVATLGLADQPDDFLPNDSCVIHEID